MACATNDDCESGRCVLATSHCQECTTAKQCADGEECRAGLCAKAAVCKANSDCAAGSTCRNGECLPQCDKDKDCPGVYHCSKDVCELDVCDTGYATCSPTGDATLTCTGNGDGFDLSPCAKGQACTLSHDSPECVDRLCTPKAWSCDDAHAMASLCSADGLSVASSVDCAADGKVCSDGECVAKVCEPSVRRCRDGAVATCDDSGAKETVEPCADGERCDAESAACVPISCAAGATGCIGETVATCRDDGSGYDPTGEECADSQQACWEGACKPVVCTDGFACVEGDSFECTENRTRLSLVQHCQFANGQFCNADVGKCQDFVCTPGLPACNGDLATSCADDGSHPLDSGTDCTVAGKVCWAGNCKLPICESDSFVCEGAELKHCVHNGTLLEAVKTCGEGTVCDAAAGTCRLQKCAPNEPACDQDVATTCDDTGLGYTEAREDCTASDNVCVSGACKPVICAADAVFCSENELRKCGPNGGSYEVLDACLASEFCDAAQAACKPDVCLAGSPVCNANQLTTCNDDGSGPTPGGLDCAASNQICDNAACRTVVCTPHDLMCDAGDVTLCNTAGTDWAPYDNCRAREFCDDTAPDATCAPDLCIQSGNGCSGEHLAQCNADGSGFSSIGQDCATSGKVCDLSGSCALVAVDDLTAGSADIPSADSAIHFALFRVSSSRRLSQVEASVSEDGSDPLTFLQYRANSKLGTYQLVNQKNVPGTPGKSPVSSGSITFDLTAGDFYLIAIAVKGSHTAAVVEGGSPIPVSFGQQLGGFTYVAGATPTIPNEVLVSDQMLKDDVALRLSTSAP